MDQDIHRVDEQLEVARAHRAFLDNLAETYAGKKKHEKKDPDESTIDHAEEQTTALLKSTTTLAGGLSKKRTTTKRVSEKKVPRVKAVTVEAIKQNKK